VPVDARAMLTAYAQSVALPLLPSGSLTVPPLWRGSTLYIPVGSDEYQLLVRHHVDGPYQHLAGYFASLLNLDVTVQIVPFDPSSGVAPLAVGRMSAASPPKRPRPSRMKRRYRR
jgi:hypothetical protein